jgi:hypothetical protein
MQDGLAAIGQIGKFMQCFIVFVFENSDHYSLFWSEDTA